MPAVLAVAVGCAAGDTGGGAASTPSPSSPAATPYPSPPGAPAPEGEGGPAYLALGDSLAAGVGAPLGEGYVDLVYAALGERLPGLDLVGLGVSGETTGSMLAPGGQLERAEQALRTGGVRLVTIDIGANDGLGCALAQDERCIDAALDEIRENLATVLTRLRAADPDVPVVAADYYLPVPPQLQSDPAEVAAALRVLGRLNGALAEVYASFGVPVAPVSAAFGGDDPVSVVERTCALTPMCSGTPDIHPNAAGHAVIAQALLATAPDVA
ncbi:MAG TPA: SGNH/GDSL hydrolase family protein [Jiangellales bacterium]|nr:SGNH/GDSL hydrolase family protein [Jiangellales bacterium]